MRQGQLFIIALVVGGALGSTELWNDLVAIPALGHLGTLMSTVLLAMIVLRFRFFGRELSASTALYALALAALAVFGYLIVFRLFASNTAILVLGTTTVTLALLEATREVVASVSVRREQRKRMIGMGRFAAQMAHDLKNPLAALKGAIQYLIEERARGASLSEQGEFLELMNQQVERLDTVVNKYKRLSRVEPIFTPVDINEVVHDVLALQSVASREGITVEIALTEGLPRCQADRDLIAGALENLVRNAFEAMPGGGTVRVRTERWRSGGPDESVVITVEDEGVGMDARQRERAFDDFYTTKTEGSGLGLAFVARVAEAHRGEVTLTSRVGQGTAVRLRLPVV